MKILQWFAFVVALVTSFDVAADDVRFKLINGTAYPMRVLTISQADIGEWGPNVLATPIKPGEAREVLIRGAIVDCNVDFKVTFDTVETHPVWKYLNLCNLRQVRLKFDPLIHMTTASYDE